MIQTIIHDILTFYNMFENKGKKIAIVVFLGTLLYERIIRKCLNKSFWETTVIVRAITVSMLSFYIYLVIGITLLSRTEEYIDVVNLLPFSVILREWTMKVLIYENILLFVPYSIFLYVLAKPFRRVSVSLFTGIISSFAIEVAQKVTHCGRFEIDDIMMNGCGMLIGFGICKFGRYVLSFLFSFFGNDNE